jgi:uridine phosphorylase
MHELICLGVKRAIRVGTCGALDGSLGLGDLVVAERAIVASGASAALGAGEQIDPDGPLTQALLHSAAGDPRAPAWHSGTIVSTDLFYDPDSSRDRDWSARRAIAVEMEAATLFAVGAAAGVPVACLLTVSDLIGADQSRMRIEDDALQRAAEAMGKVAAAALSC